MAYKKILTIQDISCVGQCSLTVALPSLSACGLETCILPSAVLSTQTAGFNGFTFRDLTDDMPSIQAHWQKENIKFISVKFDIDKNDLEELSELTGKTIQKLNSVTVSRYYDEHYEIEGLDRKSVV